MVADAEEARERIDELVLHPTYRERGCLKLSIRSWCNQARERIDELNLEVLNSANAQV